MPPAHHAPLGYRTSPRWRAPVATGLAALVGTAVVGIGNPNTTHVPLCPLLAITGLDCPLCGSLRAVHSLTRADLLGALDHNLVFTAAAPFLVVAYGIWLLRSLGRPVAPKLRLPPWTFSALLVLGLVWGVIRNVPAFGWLGSGA